MIRGMDDNALWVFNMALLVIGILWLATKLVGC
jgi:hypothetical protein